MSELFFFNRLESDAVVGQSVVGVNGSILGSPTYSANKFGNGTDSCTTTKTPYFTDAITQAQLNSIFTFECWWKPPYDSTSNTADSIATFGNDGLTQICIVHAYPSLGTGGHITVYCIKESPATGSIYTWASSESWSANEEVRIGVIFNASGGAGNRLRLFVNNVEQSSPTILGYGGDAQWTMPSNGILKPCSPSFGINSSRVDNYKLYNGAKTDFNDMFDERGGLNDQIMLS